MHDVSRTQAIDEPFTDPVTNTRDAVFLFLFSFNRSCTFWSLCWDRPGTPGRTPLGSRGQGTCPCTCRARRRRPSTRDSGPGRRRGTLRAASDPGANWWVAGKLGRQLSSPRRQGCVPGMQNFCRLKCDLTIAVCRYNFYLKKRCCANDGFKLSNRPEEGKH